MTTAKKQLKFKLSEEATGSEFSVSTFCPVGTRPASAIALRVSNMFGFPCTVHEPTHAADTCYRVEFFDEASEVFRSMTAELTP